MVVALGILASILVLGFYREQRNELENQDSFYQKLQDGFDVNILIVGDSISAGSGASDEDHRWFNMLKKDIEETYHVKVLMNNVSLGGNTSYAGYVRTSNLQDGDIYDLTILCFAQNDSPSELPFYYESLVRAVKQNCPKSDIISIKESTLRKEKHIPKVEAIEGVSAYYGIPVADMVKAYLATGLEYEELSEDKIHPSDSGQQVYYETMRDLIWRGAEEGWERNDTVKGPMNADALTTDAYQYYDKSKLVQLDELNYGFLVDNFEGKMGLDYDFDLGDHEINVLVNESNYMTIPLSQKGQTSQRYIWVVDDSCKLDGKIVLSFSDIETVNQFNGIILNGK